MSLEGKQDSRRLRDLIEAVPDATVVADSRGGIAAVNGQAERLLGYSPAELIGRDIEVLLPERFRGKHVEHRAAYARDPRQRGMGSALSLYARCKDGSEIPVEISLSPFGDGEDRVVIAAIRDVSERRKMQEILRRSEERLRLLIESVREYAIFMLDSEGRVATWSPGAERIKGYAAHEILGKPLAIFYPPEDVAAGKPARALAAAVRDGGYHEEGWRVRQDGSRFQADVTLTPLFDPDGTLRGFSKVTKDVTERKKAEEDRERAIRARDEILTLLSHDLGNAVNALSLNTQLLLRVQPATQREVRMHGYGRIVGRSANTMRRLIEDLLDVQQMELGQFSIDPRPEEVPPLVEEAIEPLQALAGEKYVSLEARFDSVARAALCDKARIVQVLHNLVGNAIKFVPDGGRVVVGTTLESAHVRFAVEDNGPGILPEDLPYVFERHWQAPSYLARRGSGLGLFIVKTIVEAHAGRAWVRSTPGTGASFFFTLPAA